MKKSVMEQYKKIKNKQKILDKPCKCVYNTKRVSLSETMLCQNCTFVHGFKKHKQTTGGCKGTFTDLKKFSSKLQKCNCVVHV